MAETWGRFPELSEQDNATIVQARQAGWAVFYPAYPTAKAQAEKTLRGATEFLAYQASRKGNADG